MKIRRHVSVKRQWTVSLISESDLCRSWSLFLVFTSNTSIKIMKQNEENKAVQ